MKCDVCQREIGPRSDDWCEHVVAGFEEAFAKWEERLQAQIEANRRSEMLTAEDFNIRINCVAD